MEAIKILYKTLDNVQTEKTKLFHKTKLGEHSKKKMSQILTLFSDAFPNFVLWNSCLDVV